MKNNQEIMAIVIDLDGTLLDSQKRVSQRNIDSILKCYAQGIRIVFATARPPRAVQALLPAELRDIATHVFYNGALITLLEDGVKLHHAIPSHITAEIYDFALQESETAAISLEHDDEWVSHQDLDYAELMNVQAKPRIIDLQNIRERQATKILLTNFDKVEELRNRFAHHVSIVQTDGGRLIQIMAHEISKKSAIINICSKLDIPLDRVIAFGDDLNDFELFEICGHSIAMGNAISELKKVARYVTDTNDRDGIAIFLEKVVQKAVSTSRRDGT